MNLSEANKADARLKNEHALMLHALQRIRDDAMDMPTAMSYARSVLRGITTQQPTPLPDGGGPFDAAVERIIVFVDKALEKKHDTHSGFDPC